MHKVGNCKGIFIKRKNSKGATQKELHWLTDVHKVLTNLTISCQTNMPGASGCG